MSTEQRKELMDGFKGLLWIVVTIAGFLIADRLAKIDNKLDKLDQIESRLIRVEYELKLK